MKKPLFTRKWVILLLHIAAWLLLFSLPFLLRPDYGEGQKARPRNEGSGLPFYIINNLMWVGLFYLNSLVLIPYLVYQKKVAAFIFTYLALFFIYLLIGWANTQWLKDEPRFNWRWHILLTFFIYLFFLATSTAYQMARDRMKADKQAKEKETENLKTELSLLRSQVSPHFMFNVLNNMVALARKQSDQLEPSLLKLSSLMRYMLYDSDGDKVPLEKEIDYLQSYIDLQRQRFGKHLVISVDFSEVEAGCEIEPMLLIPFVENAFKHGTGMLADPKIEIELRTRNKLLQFQVRNRFAENSEEIKDNTSGIGLTNVKRRLNLLYGKNHTLLITKQEGWFITALQLNLH